MTLHRGRKFVFCCAALALLAVGVFYLNIRMQASAVNRMHRALKSVPAPHTLRAEEITAGFFGRTVTLRGVEANIAAGEDVYVLRAGQAEIKGLAPMPRNSGAVLPLVDTLVLREFSFSGPDYEENTAEYRIHDVKADLLRILAARENFPAVPPTAAEKKTPERGAEEKQKAQAASEFLLALETLHIGKILSQDSKITYRAASQGLTLAAEGGQWLEVNLRRMGPWFMRNVRVNLDNRELFFLDRISMDSVVLPSFGRLAADGAADRALTGKKALRREAFKNQRLVLDNLAVKGLSILSNHAAPIKLSSFSASLEAAMAEDAACSLALSWRFAELNVPKETLNRLAESVSGNAGPFGKPVLFSGDMAFSLAGRSAEVIDAVQSSLSIQAKDIADIRAAVVLEEFPLSLANGGKLKTASLAVTDYKGSDLLIKAFALSQDADAARVRAAMASELEKQMPMLPSALLPVFSSCIAFIRNPGGTLNLSITPQKKLLLREVPALVILVPEQMGISASFTPSSR